MEDTAFGPSPTLPARFGRYHVVAVIPGGNMGRLYLAQDPEIDRMVVVKALDGDRTQEEKHRFLREARAAGRLSHANVVSIFDVGEQDRTPFIVMEYIDGDTVANLIKNRVALLFSRRLEMVDQLCAGLAYAHDQGVVHRDIKPSNLMLDKADTLRVLDFGIARLDSGEHTQTSSGVIGTLNYMSPEQWEGGVIEQRSDIFSVGAVVYELFSYTRAFPGSTPPEVLRAVFGDGPPPLEDVAHGTPPELSAIVHRMMARAPEDRYPSLHVVRAAIAGLKEPMRAAEEQLLGETIHMDRPPAPPSTPTSAPRSTTSIGQTSSIVRDFATSKRSTPTTSVQQPATTTATRTRVTAPVTRTSIQTPTMTMMQDAPTMAVPAPAPAPSQGGHVVFISVAAAIGLIALGILGVLAWQGRFSNAQKPADGAPTSIRVGTPPDAGSSTTTPPAAQTTTAPTAGGPSAPASAANGASKTPATSTQASTGAQAANRGGRGADAGTGRAANGAGSTAPKTVHLVVSGPYDFELRQGNKVISESASRHELEIDVNAGAVTARNASYFLNFPVNPRSSSVEIPALGHLIVNATTSAKECRLMIDGQDAGTPTQPSPGLPIASGSHQIGLKCGTALPETSAREISASEPTIIVLGKSSPGDR